MQIEQVDRDGFYQHLERMLTLSSGSIEGTTKVRDLKGWDSLAILEFMTMASMEYDSEVEPAELTQCTDVDELANVVFAARSSKKDSHAD